jgi:predicted NodU family carbamoyl transferase
MDIAASIQAVTEEIVLRLTRSLAAETGERNLCLAGGVALNCVANGKVLRDKHFKRIWVQPASGDSGGAVWNSRDRARLEMPATGWRVHILGPRTKLTKLQCA